MKITPQILVQLLKTASNLRTYMLNNLDDAELDFRVPGNPTLGELCREMGNIERAYLDSFKTLKMANWNTQSESFDAERDETMETATRVEKLKQWYKSLDEEFETVLMGIPESEFELMKIERSGRSIPADWHYHTYHEALLIFCARCGVYLRMMNKPLNKQWLDWIG